MKIFTQLTPREKEILVLLAKGYANAEISSELHISIYTVQNHVSNLLQKLDVRNRSAASAIYWQRMSEQSKK